jgi:hypothetical protein
MRINHKILSIPPYISTSWKNIVSLHVEYRQNLPLLLVDLHSGQRIEVPHLDPPIIEAIFHAHAKFMDQESSKMVPLPLEANGAVEHGMINFPLKISMGGMDGFASVLQHNQEQADAPSLPAEILIRIAELTKTIGLDGALIPESEPHCNCIHCQMVRAVQQVDQQKESLPLDEEVSAEDLKFRNWDIHQAGNKLFVVTNPLDEKEKYNVYLGEPVGCTCGQKSCEHILAVLKS